MSRGMEVGRLGKVVCLEQSGLRRGRGSGGEIGRGGKQEKGSLDGRPCFSSHPPGPAWEACLYDNSAILHK